MNIPNFCIGDCVKAKGDERAGEVVWVGDKLFCDGVLVSHYAIEVKWFNKIYGDLKGSTAEFIRDWNGSTVTR